MSRFDCKFQFCLAGYILDNILSTLLQHDKMQPSRYLLSFRKYLVPWVAVEVRLHCTLNPKSANHDCSRRHSYIFFHCFSIRLDVSSESSAGPRIREKPSLIFFER